MRRINNNLRAIEDAFIGLPKSNTGGNPFQTPHTKGELWGSPQFQEGVDPVYVLAGCFLYSQRIDIYRIQYPSPDFTKEKKLAFFLNVYQLVKDWTFLGKTYSYEEFASVAFDTEEDRKKFELSIKSIAL
jgi:hypothetical protein